MLKGFHAGIHVYTYMRITINNTSNQRSSLSFVYDFNVLIFENNRFHNKY